MPERLNLEERATLLKLARQSLINAANNQPAPPLPKDLPAALLAEGASFVTLTVRGRLRGCIGTLQAYQPLANDVRQRAAQAAVEDYRFPRVRPNEVDTIHIEISRLTKPVPLAYSNPSELPGLLKPHVDGVVLSDGRRRATFLPQVWQQLPDVAEFLSHLCQKMGVQSDLWRREMLEVETYQVEEFEEAE